MKGQKTRIRGEREENRTHKIEIEAADICMKKVEHNDYFTGVGLKWRKKDERKS